MGYKFLIFGASGFVGKPLWERVKEKKFPALGTTYGENSEEFLNFNLATDNLSQVLPGNFLAPEDQAVAIILAGIANGDFCFRNKDASYQINVKGTTNLISDLQQAGIKIVYISSGAVFDGVSGNYNEASAVSPIMEYGRQKALVEDFIGKNCSDFLIVRLSKVVADTPGQKHIFSQWQNDIITGKPINCFSGEYFSPTDAGDVANGILLLIEKQLRGIYHLAGPEVFTREELARKFFQLMNKSAQIVVKNAQDFGLLEKRPLKVDLNSSKFAKDAGMPFRPMQEVMSSFLTKSA
ncbi:MAG: sugar nucleotide-binding protein [Candidatus Omnitrophica bacterium]|nr:sugar nucleotide-binding protein [Candidatus Omnitrophota bacterium]